MLRCSELALTADPRVNPANLVSAMERISSQSRPSFGHCGCPLSRDRGSTVRSKLRTQTTGLGEMRFFFFFFLFCCSSWLRNKQQQNTPEYSVECKVF